jgi:hypothetical protein
MKSMQEKKDANLQENTARMETKMDGRQKEIKAQTASLASRIEGNKEKFEVLQAAFVSRMDIHQEKMEVTTQSIRSELEDTIKHLVEGAVSCVDQETQSLRKEPTEKIHETQVVLQTIKTSFDTRRKDLLEAITDTREHLQTEFDLFQEKTRTIRDTIITSQGNVEAKMEANCSELQSQLDEVAARAERGEEQEPVQVRHSHQISTGLYHGPRSGASSRL